MKDLFWLLGQIIKHMHPLRKVGFLGLAGALLGFWLMKVIPESGDDVIMRVIVAGLTLGGLVCIVFADQIMPLGPAPQQRTDDKRE